MSFLVSCFACAAFAQAAAAPPAVPPSVTPRYESPFADYRPFSVESPMKPWRAANDDVREAGGHVGILKGMSAPAAASASGKSPAGGAASTVPKESAPAGVAKEPAKPAPAHRHDPGSGR
jgi:hypothetical protein